MATEKYNELIFQLGDLARERLASKPGYPRSMERVFRAEEALLARRDELAALEQALNDEDSRYQQFLADQEAENATQQEIVRKYKKAVDAIQGRVKELRKKLGSSRADLRYERVNIKQTEARLHDLEMTSTDESKVDQARAFLKKSRLILMRKQRNLEDLGRELEMALTPKPGQPGAAGILAHKRILEMEDEAEERKQQFDEAVAEWDRQIAAKEQEIQAAEDYLDQALFLLGEECYALRVADPALAPFYPRIDRAR